MVRPLLIRGMLAGLVAGLPAFGFASLFGAPQVDRAIAVEEPHAAAAAAALVGAAIAITLLALPTINEVPSDVPADLLWFLGITSLGIQLVLWAAVGIVFGALAARSLLPVARSPGHPHPA